MNRIQFGEGACENSRKYLDAYVSNELLVETNHDLLRHLETCPSCAAEADARTRLRARLKAAVNAQPVPSGLQVRIREQIQGKRRRSSRLSGRWMLAWAASLLLGAGVWLNYAPERLPALSDRPAQNAYIARVSANLAAVLKVGLGDHIHCSIFRKYPKEPPTIQKMEADLGPAYAGLLPVVRAAVPQGYRVIMAHQCSYLGRKFVHLTFERNGDLLSLVIARKQPGESFETLPPATVPSGLRIYQSAAGRYQVAGFEAGNLFAYVVSTLNKKANLQIAANVAPGVREFLIRTAA